MRIVHQIFLYQILENRFSIRQFLFEFRERFLEANPIPGRAVVDPLRHHAQHHRQALREAACIELAQAELVRVHGRLHRLRLEARAHQALQRLLDERLHFARVCALHALHAHREGALQQLVAEAAARHALSQLRLRQSLAQGGGGGAQQQVVQHAQRHLLFRRQLLLVQQPVQRDHVFGLHARSHGEAHLHALRLGQTGLQGHLGGDGDGVELAQVAVQQAQALHGVVVAVEEHAAVRRVVVGGVEGLELVERQVGDLEGVAAAVHAVRVLGEERALRGSAHDGIGGAVHALHLVVHHALDGERSLRALVQLVVPALLLQHLRVVDGARVQHCVQVHVDQVVEVLRVRRRHWIAGSVWISERIQKILKRSLQ
mmetsp:Transcript_4276/g.6879  ORF Transcript_4276/g.6879 Transcript_4276/m.6879 type:complete len:372 (+) Transcript_4276:3541-4656(+)